MTSTHTEAKTASLIPPVDVIRDRLAIVRHEEKTLRRLLSVAVRNERERPAARQYAPAGAA